MVGDVQAAGVEPVSAYAVRAADGKSWEILAGDPGGDDREGTHLGIGPGDNRPRRFLGSAQCAPDYISSLVAMRAQLMGWQRHPGASRRYPLEEPLPEIPGSPAASDVRLSLVTIVVGSIGFAVEAAGERFTCWCDSFEDSERLFIHFVGLLGQGGEPHGALADDGGTHFVVHKPSCTCPDCGAEMRKMGEDVTEVLEYVPFSFKVIRHVRPKMSCRRCETIVQTPMPFLPIVRGKAGPGLLVHVLVSKYADHLPLYHQQEIYAREGIELERSTLAGWVGQTATLLEPLIETLRRDVLLSSVLHGDDTPVPVLAPGLGKTKKGRLWAYVRDGRPNGSDQPPAAVFFYSPDRKGTHPQSHLKGFKGILHADGYAGFNAIFERSDVAEAACWAHVRRKFLDVHAASGAPLAKEALDRIGNLYAIEDTIRGKPPDERRRWRMEQSASLIADLKAWIDATFPKLSGNSELAHAMRYTLSWWKALTCFLDDGTVEIDNNAAERAIRGIALGRKNWLFAGSDAGGERAAAIFSLLETAKLNNLESPILSPQHHRPDRGSSCKPRA